MAVRGNYGRWCSQACERGGSRRVTSRFRALAAAATLGLCGLALTGCERSIPPTPDVALSATALDTVPTVSNGTAPEATIHQKPPAILLTHDFGQLRPDERVTYVFQISNNSRVTWTLKKITRHCNCAVANLSADEILPGATAEATLAYRAPPKRNDDHRVVEISFKEARAPLVRLEVTAAIRPPLLLSADAVRLHCANTRSPTRETIEVENYSDADWDAISVTADQSWLSAAAELVRSDDGPRRARQLWRVTLAAEPSALKPGRYSADLRLICRAADQPDGGGASAKLPVGLHVTGPIEFVPEQMFFGNLDERGEADCAVWIRCFAYEPKFVASNLVIEHDMGGWLRCELLRGENERLELRAKVTIPKAVETARGLIKLSLKGEILELPVQVIR
jgi:hypothetical protein